MTEITYNKTNAAEYEASLLSLEDTWFNFDDLTSRLSISIKLDNVEPDRFSEENLTGGWFASYNYKPISIKRL